MSVRNGKQSDEPVEDRLAQLKPGGGIGPEQTAFLQARTEGFQRATSGKGQPLTYGTGKPRSDTPKKGAKK